MGILTKFRIYRALRREHYKPSYMTWRGSTVYFLAHGSYAYKAIIKHNTLSIFRLNAYENQLIERIEI